MVTSTRISEQRTGNDSSILLPHPRGLSLLKKGIRATAIVLQNPQDGFLCFCILHSNVFPLWPTLLYYAVPESFMLELGHRTVGTLDSGCMNTKRETFRPWEMNG